MFCDRIHCKNINGQAQIACLMPSRYRLFFTVTLWLHPLQHSKFSVTVYRKIIIFLSSLAFTIAECLCSVYFQTFLSGNFYSIFFNLFTFTSTWPTDAAALTLPLQSVAPSRSADVAPCSPSESSNPTNHPTAVAPLLGKSWRGSNALLIQLPL